MTTRHRHRFQRLSDEAIFCECGEVRYVGKPYTPTPSITVDPIRLPDPWIGPQTTTPNMYPRWVPNPTTVTVSYPNDGRMIVSSTALSQMRSVRPAS